MQKGMPNLFYSLNDIGICYVTRATATNVVGLALLGGVLVTSQEDPNGFKSALDLAL